MSFFNQQPGPRPLPARSFEACISLSGSSAQGIRAFLRRCKSEKLLRKNPIEKTISFHSLRHGFCTRLAEAGKPLQVIKEAARHSDVSTSMIYVHMANEHLKAELDNVFS